jgi:signal transduction histidine kinase
MLLFFYRRRVSGLEKEKRTQQEFSARLMESQENERKRIAGELHDSLGQNLLVIRNRALLGLKDHAISEQARNQLDQISSVATQAINEVREIAYDLRPYQLDRLGLTKAITSITSELVTSVQFSMNVDHIDGEVEKDLAIHVYRIVQEGINNILKHADATEAQVVIRVEPGNLRITISDNGKGMPRGSPGAADDRHAHQLDESYRRQDGQGFGLVGITERAKVLKGTVEVEATPGKGTTLTLVIPRSGRGHQNKHKE